MAEPYVYMPFKWLDQIIELDEFGNTVYEKDDDGNIVYWKDSLGNAIIDPINKKPIPKPKLSQVGTRHTATRENHQEQGIAKAHERLDGQSQELLRMWIHLELDGKAPGNSGTFSDTFDGPPNQLVRQSAQAILTESRSSGNKSLNVDNTDGFKKLTEATIYDGNNSEDVLVTDITKSTITVQELKNDYVKGAVIARSNSAIKNGRMSNGSWSTMSVEVV